ncbi:DNA transfer protein [Vibrio phage D260]
MSTTIKAMSKETQKRIIALAMDENFYGKRKRLSRLEVCDKVCDELELTQDQLPSAEMCDWLLENKPVKKAAKKASIIPEELEPVFEGASCSRDDALEVLEDGTYIITSVQNNTTPHASFYGLEWLAKRCGAALLAMPIHYVRNLDKKDRKNVKYHADVKQYLLDNDVFLGSKNGVRLAVNANIVVTAKQPINNAEQLNAGEALTIVASPRSQVRSLQRAKNQSEKYAMTSKCSTLRHYANDRIASESEKDHWFGGIMVCVDNGSLTIKQIESNERGDVMLDGQLFTSKGESLDVELEAIVLGDIHCEKSDPVVWNDTISLMNAYQPDTVVLHDLFDMMSRNHHNRESGKFLYEMGNRTVLEDLQDVAQTLADVSPYVRKVFVVASNHNLALDTWLDDNKYNPSKDPLNAKLYHLLKFALLEMMDNGDESQVLEMAMRELDKQSLLTIEMPDNIVFGDLDELKMLGGHDCGQHGHIGAGGARGSIKTFKRYSVPNVTGHTHSGARDGHALIVGVKGAYDMGYNKGHTRWTRDDAFIYDNGMSYLQPQYALTFEV